jgi:hypothetical protein
MACALQNLPVGIDRPLCWQPQLACWYLEGAGRYKNGLASYLWLRFSYTIHHQRITVQSKEADEVCLSAISGGDELGDCPVGLWAGIRHSEEMLLTVYEGTAFRLVDGLCPYHVHG